MEQTHVDTGHGELFTGTRQVASRFHRLPCLCLSRRSTEMCIYVIHILAMSLALAAPAGWWGTAGWSVYVILFQQPPCSQSVV